MKEKFIEYKSHMFRLKNDYININVNNHILKLYHGELYNINIENSTITIPEYIKYDNKNFYITTISKSVIDYITYNSKYKYFTFDVDSNNICFLIENDCIYLKYYIDNPFNLSGDLKLYRYIGNNKSLIINKNTISIDAQAFDYCGNSLKKIIFNNKLKIYFDNIEKFCGYLPNLNYIEYYNKILIKNKNNKWVIK